MRSAGVGAVGPPRVLTFTPFPYATLFRSTAVIEVSEFTVRPAGAPPKVTAVAPESPAPVIVTTDPPDTGPEFGLTPVTAGATNRLTYAGGDVNVPSETEYEKRSGPVYPGSGAYSIEPSGLMATSPCAGGDSMVGDRALKYGSVSLNRTFSAAGCPAGTSNRSP